MKADTIKVKIAKSLRVGTVDNRLQNLSLFDWLTDVQHMCTFLKAVTKISILRGGKYLRLGRTIISQRNRMISASYSSK